MQLGNIAPRIFGPTFEQPIGRYIVLLWLGSYLFDPVYWLLNWALPSETSWYWFDAGYYVARELSWAAILLLLGAWSAVNWQKLFGRPARPADSTMIVATVLFCLVASFALVYAVYLPLSWYVPDFVNLWLIDLPDAVYREGDVYPFVPNMLGFLSLTVFTPIVEETMFRGLLLHRWARKFGLMTSVMLSSGMFAIAHPDVGGAFVFAVMMSILYLRTQSLFVPIVCHAIYNLIAWVWTLIDMLRLGPDFKYTLEEFQNDWWFGAVGGAVMIIWVITYMRRRRDETPWKLPLS